jgi:hypothetical protein
VVVFMTRREFLNDVTTVDDLISFLSDEDNLFLATERNDWLDTDSFDECVLEDIRDFYTDETWHSIGERLCSTPDWNSDAWYVRNGCFDYDMVEDGDDHYQELYDDTLEYFDDNGLWDDDPDEEDDEEEEVEAALVEAQESSVDISLLNTLLSDVAVFAS